MNELIDDAGHSELDRLAERIRQHYPNMPKKLQEIANFALVYPETMALSTLSDLEQRTSINNSAFVRFAKYMNFAGLPSWTRYHLMKVLKHYQARLPSLF
jgi:DNA-binding MurR/RpiR family transcriptional regulator